ncbi:MAG: hypothetical protein JRJ86_01900 [Deltaproteobacteria bacterium]|nr:hypothetical protein [Deltaproteobacteria bacterium]MBW2116622.1 hypothetical protein [Deltaproteobacteria bacterium]MBW2342810.1 hypothetical protein [Deltaproteobacteria bacterium]
MAGGPGAIIDAIAAGQRAATSIDKFLGGDGVKGQVHFEMPFCLQMMMKISTSPKAN